MKIENKQVEAVGYVLMEGGKVAAFFDEIPAGSHYAPSAYMPVGLIEGPVTCTKEQS